MLDTVLSDRLWVFGHSDGGRSTGMCGCARTVRSTGPAIPTRRAGICHAAGANRSVFSTNSMRSSNVARSGPGVRRRSIPARNFFGPRSAKPANTGVGRWRSSGRARSLRARGRRSISPGRCGSIRCQTLIVTAGCGRARHEGGAIEEIRPGDVVWFPPGEKHWHGAAPATAMTHIAIQEKLDGSPVEWMEQVSDAEYEG